MLREWKYFDGIVSILEICVPSMLVVHNVDFFTNASARTLLVIG